jgi:SAM-dependent methyltransferase
MEPEYARRYRALWERHWWWRARRRLILSCLTRLRAEAPFGRILDVGCGSGLFFEALSAFGSVEGVEPDVELAAASAWRDHIHAGPFDRSLGLEGTYGLVLFLDVLEHLADPVPALRYAVDLLAPGGRVVITVPAFRFLWTHHDVINRHERRYTRRGLGRELRAAGLAAREVRYFFHWTVAAKLAVRLVEGLSGRPSPPPRVPPAGLNAALYALSRLEQRAIGPLRLPFGTSILAIASRAE